MNVRLALMSCLTLLLVGCTGIPGQSTATPGYLYPTLTRGPTPIPGAVSVVRGQTFGLRIGQEATLTDSGIMVRFVGVDEDSRCPRAVNCAWSGQATIRVAFWMDGQDQVEQKLSYLGMNTQTEQSSVEFAGATLRFQLLEPYPELPTSIPDDEYSATLIFE